ncbi:MAG: signal recognition particle subunit FFH/SRP54 (srp54), signal recognition particle subunit SRP54 [Candidatus Dadabacteria bacterium CSP1-2]|nr:MAG: signal recognition particle subunit FFH/SRP54 (srp54), signal recognition particle subunit SRP54 [Candidatus Dadabacteria bacterium CSP1-2]
MFEGISEKLSSTLKKIRGYGKLSENNIQDALREVRLILLEADVNFKVVKDFIESVKNRALGQEVIESLTPGQQFIKIVHEELVRILGEESSDLDLRATPPVAIMLVGLQGSGKTTTAAKLAKLLKENLKRKPYLVPADVYRPAAIEQLKVLAETIGVGVYDSQQGNNPVDICKDAVSSATYSSYDVVIIDTAGRLHIDEELMDELRRIKAEINPHEILLVADAMTGQDAVNVSTSFNEALDIDGIILTKMDGDARGGAALSIKAVTGKPIKFFGVGEKLEALEVFYPERIASRIIGMGDVLTFIEKAQVAFEEKKAEEMAKKLLKNEFSLEDFREAMIAIRKMGTLDSMTEMIPGMKQIAKNPKALEMAEKEIKKTIAIIDSMTLKERRSHTILNGSRRKRIAKGSGTKVEDTNRVIKNYVQMRDMMKNMGKMGKLAKRMMRYM